MSNKNPFEIRSEVLGMAKDYMDKQYAMNVDFTKRMFDEGKKTAEEMQVALQPYAVEDLIKRATEMYAFVLKKD
jgi:hypothetical protein